MRSCYTGIILKSGVFVSFEENLVDLKKNFMSLGYDLDKLVADKKLAIDHVLIERSLMEETGSYDLEALFIRLGFVSVHSSTYRHRAST